MFDDDAYTYVDFQLDISWYDTVSVSGHLGVVNLNEYGSIFPHGMPETVNILIGLYLKMTRIRSH